jgi:hypothetical protein
MKNSKLTGSHRPQSNARTSQRAAPSMAGAAGGTGLKAGRRAYTGLSGAQVSNFDSPFLGFCERLGD